MHTSRYTIYVDLPDNDREILLVHGYTGAYDRVSRGVASFLRSRELGPAPKPLYGEWAAEETAGEAPRPSDAALTVLQEQGYLTALSPEEEESQFRHLVERLHERSLHSPPTYILMPTYDCNLRCFYCFQDHMRTDARFGHLLHTMDHAMADRIFASLPHLEALHGLDPETQERRSFGFFGGEPLLAANRPIVEYLIERALAAGGGDLWAVTNATELEAYADLLGPAALARLQITLDGPPEEHDRRRIDAAGGGSYQRIARNLDLALERGVQVSVRLNVDRNNLGELPAVADELARRGWDRHPGFSAYTAAVSALNEQTDPKDTFGTMELDRRLAEMRELHPNLAALARPNDGLRSRARRIFAGNGEEIPDFRPSFCGAHDRSYLFDPFGNLYACWEKTGDSRVSIGNLRPDGTVELRVPQLQAWRSRTVASNPVCSRCRYGLHCGGGCAVQALAQRGTLHASYCDQFATRFRTSVAESYLEHVGRATAREGAAPICSL